MLGGLLVTSLPQALFAQDTAASNTPPLWLAVCRPTLVKAIAPLAAHRRKQGLRTIISTQAIAKAVAAAPVKPAFLLLVGDDEPGKEDENWYLGAKRRSFYRWRGDQRKEFASDWGWSDKDGDGLPDFAVGRIPARTLKDVALVVEKIIVFEERQPTEADLRLLFWAGTADYGGALADTLIRNLLLGLVEKQLPKWIEPWLICADSTHALCGWPPDQPALFSSEMSRGSLASIFMGHGHNESLYSMEHRGQRIRFTARHAAKRLDKGPPTAPFMGITCLTGDFTLPRRSLAEALLFAPGGPVVAIGATTESHPLPNYYTALQLMDGLNGNAQRVGDIWLKAQRSMMRSQNFLVERVLRDVEGSLEEHNDVHKLKRDQLFMYAILGDPATRLKLPGKLQVAAKRTDVGWQWTLVEAERTGKLTVGLKRLHPKYPAIKGVSNREQARMAFRKANGEFVFQSVQQPPLANASQGSVSTNGLLRITVTGPQTFKTAVLRLRPRPSPSKK